VSVTLSLYVCVCHYLRMTDGARPSWIPQWTMADRLRKIRRDSKMSQEDFAHVLGIKPTTWAAWESGRNSPERVLELANLIEDRLDVPAAWLLGLLDRPTRGGDMVAAMQPQRRRSTDRVTCIA
jgi:DNA-binding XRE family transcriptional regulator